MSTDWWIEEIVIYTHIYIYIYTNYYSVLKKKEILSYVTTEVNPERHWAEWSQSGIERKYHMIFSSVQSSSVAQSCPTLCDPMNRSTPGPPVHHHLPEFTQTHVHQVCDAIQPSHPQSSPSPPAPNPSLCLVWKESNSEAERIVVTRGGGGERKRGSVPQRAQSFSYAVWLSSRPYSTGWWLQLIILLLRSEKTVNLFLKKRR